jgi:hypothetical protein
LRDGDELGPGTTAIYADALRVRTKMTSTGETIPAMAAGDVTFADHKIAFGKTFHVIADAIDYADEFVTDGNWHGDRFLRPGVPVIYMYVGSADGGLEDADENVVASDFGNWDFLEPQSRLSFRLHDGLHRFLHKPNLSE